MKHDRTQSEIEEMETARDCENDEQPWTRADEAAALANAEYYDEIAEVRKRRIGPWEREKVRIWPGQLMQVFHVVCGMCKERALEPVPAAETKTEAGRVLFGAGWRNTRAWGWICPQCEHHGSPGVIPRDGGK